MILNKLPRIRHEVWEKTVKTLLTAAMLAAATGAYASEPDAGDMLALIEAQQKQIEMLQQQLDATKATLETLSQQVATNTRASEEANEKAEILADNIESQPAVTEPATKLGASVWYG